MRRDPSLAMPPRTFVIAGKAAPGYAMAKLLIKLVHDVANRVNGDPSIGETIRVVFLKNYGATLAQHIIPAADLSEQISTAGMEASGTGNMKLSLNGALTIGTLDGANIEIREEVGEENIFVFGLTAEEVARTRVRGYDPWERYHGLPELREALDMIAGAELSPGSPGLFRPLVDSLLGGGDPFMVLADYEAYVACQERVGELYRDPEAWTRMSILNVASMGKFSSDRTIREYASEIWGVEPVVPRPKKKNLPR